MNDLSPHLATAAALSLLVASCFNATPWTRRLVGLSAALLAASQYLGQPSPVWLTLLFLGGAIAVNLFHLMRSNSARKPYQLSGEEMMLFARLPGLSPQQFKQLLAIAVWSNPKKAQKLTDEGAEPSALHYVLEGQVKVMRDKDGFLIGPHAFIGELAFLRGKPATATTFAQPGSLLVSWKQDELKALMQGDAGIRIAIDELLSGDLAEKIARNAQPRLQEQQG